jgi:hypothetical protein
MGRFDDLTTGLTPAPAAAAPKTARGRFDDLLGDLPKSDAIKRSPSDYADVAWKMATDAAPTPTRFIKRNILEPAGEAIAEAGGRTGMKAIQYPAAAVGTVVSELPQVLGAATSLRGLYSKNPTRLAKAIRNTPRMLSQEYDAVKGNYVSGDLPERFGRVAKFPGLSGRPQFGPDPLTPNIAPKTYPRELNSFLNFAKGRVNALGKRLSPQELEDYHNELKTILNKPGLRGTEPYAIAAKIKKTVDSLRAEAIPGVGELDKVYALSKKLRIAPEKAKELWAYLGPKLRWGAMGVP